ncbi:MAG: FecR domain-containing protein, partial [Deltaproteobacteria bacterium]|nr:FecR domain-containing protein [Deltaproteobacteria bacterium]
DAIYAHDNARAEVTFHDGNVIRLASETRIEIREYAMRGSESSEVINLLRGKLRNIVKVVFDPDFQKKKGKYEIHTPIAICGVRGTDFFAYHEQEVSGAVFVEGKGYAYSRDVPNEVVTLTAGQQMTARTGREAPKVAPARSKDIERFKKATWSRAKIDREHQKVKESQKPAAKVTNQKQDRKSDQGVTPGSRGDKSDKSGGPSSGGGNSSGGSSSGGSSSGSSGGSNSGGGNSGGGNSGGGHGSGGSKK